MRLSIAVKECVYNIGLLKEIIYPRKCAVCNTEIHDGCFCEVCRRGYLLAQHRSFGNSEERLWEQMAELLPEDVLSEVFVLYKYDGCIKDSLRQIKFSSRYDLLPPLREELQLALPPRFDIWLRSFALAACVPTSAERLHQRGFDIPQELFKAVLHKYGCSYVPDLLLRVRKTAPLYALNKEERRLELDGCFAVNPAYDVRGRSILLCDDIYTTGSTFAESAAALLRAGATSVAALAFAAAKENW